MKAEGPLVQTVLFGSWVAGWGGSIACDLRVGSVESVQCVCSLERVLECESVDREECGSEGVGVQGCACVNPWVRAERAGRAEFGAREKETPLANAAFWAARRGNLALLRLLLNSGRVDVDCRDSYGTTLLMVASYAGHIDCVKELVLQGADINLQRESGTTALFFAAQQGHNDVVRFLFEFGASTEFRTKDGGTALLAASQYGHMKVVDTLLKHGANIHDQLYDGATALFLAAQGGYLDVTRLLLSSGAKVNQPRQVMSLCTEQWIKRHCRPVHIPSSQLTFNSLLIYFCFPLSSKDGTTALLKAANKGYSDVIEELLKFSPTLGILKNGTSALHAAVLSGNIKTVALLLEAGADPALRNKANKLPAELTKNERILRLLRGKEGHRKSYLSCIFD
ncbi:PREDICTED: ankyrin repeat domain-containing protein 29 [Miniopterus natalensis]|uniref:ankyrin repeat domain-containing protein 29 n=1 Tax=Miniopterus natalensis TaxID=291302 RepID=UPI0007A702A4|nr:PREDICTED: ankyrin repeat domain-containing protein 29 [Miniopterus natalensis]